MQNGVTEVVKGDQLSKLADRRLDEVYGKGGVMGYEHIRMKASEGGRKTKYAISGPRLEWIHKKVSGLLNASSYRIEETRENIVKLGLKHLEELKADPEFMASGEPILFTFTGYSRGRFVAV